MTRQKFKILLLEGVNQTAVDILSKDFEVEYHKKALSEDILIEKIKDVHAIGIRSKTQLKNHILIHAKKLLVVGCFCIGTNQVDLEYASTNGIVVFNSPFSNSRSVAELVIAEIIALSRGILDRNIEMHQGKWSRPSRKTLIDNEILGKTLGIVGYGTQLGVLADSLGMKVNFYDALPQMAIGGAHPLSTLTELLETSDFISLHVPELPSTQNMIGEKEFKAMKVGAGFINASRGSVVDLDALKNAVDVGLVRGCAVDVYPSEPFANGPGFETPLQGCKNTILSPHIGGSTEEAQFSIGGEVATAVSKFLHNGSTLGAYNIPEMDQKLFSSSSTKTKAIRVLNFHHNVPGVLKQINAILSDFNIEKQTCDSSGVVSYLIADLSFEEGGAVGVERQVEGLLERFKDVVESISIRVLVL